MMADRLDRTTGPTVFLLPMRGWSAYDQREGLAGRVRGWVVGHGDSPAWEPDPELSDLATGPWATRSTAAGGRGSTGRPRGDRLTRPASDGRGDRRAADGCSGQNVRLGGHTPAGRTLQR